MKIIGDSMKIGELISETDVDDLPTLINEIKNEARGVVDQIIKQNSVFTAEIGEQNRITIPSADRKKLGLDKGDLIQVFIRKVEPEE